MDSPKKKHKPNTSAGSNINSSSYSSIADKPTTATIPSPSSVLPALTGAPVPASTSSSSSRKRRKTRAESLEAKGELQHSNQRVLPQANSKTNEFQRDAEVTTPIPRVKRQRTIAEKSPDAPSAEAENNSMLPFPNSKKRKLDNVIIDNVIKLERNVEEDEISFVKNKESEIDWLQVSANLDLLIDNFMEKNTDIDSKHRLITSFQLYFTEIFMKACHGDRGPTQDCLHQFVIDITLNTKAGKQEMAKLIIGEINRRINIESLRITDEELRYFLSILSEPQAKARDFGIKSESFGDCSSDSNTPHHLDEGYDDSKTDGEYRMERDEEPLFCSRAKMPVLEPSKKPDSTYDDRIGIMAGNCATNSMSFGYNNEGLTRKLTSPRTDENSHHIDLETMHHVVGFFSIPGSTAAHTANNFQLLYTSRSTMFCADAGSSETQKAGSEMEDGDGYNDTDWTYG